jgi:divalent metal cation (Fe/Co/Zn/Cd) transporter
MLAEPLVRDVHDISIYNHDGRKSVSLHLKLEPDVRLRVAHEVAERVEARLPKSRDVEDVHNLASVLEDDIREGQPHMTDVVVHTEP